MTTRVIELMNGLENFGYSEMDELTELLTSYARANTRHNAKIYAALPETWCDNGVRPEFNPSSGLVFLANSELQALVNTPYGVAMHYSTPYSGYEGTLFDLAEQVTDALTDVAGKPIKASDSTWENEDLNYLFDILNADTAAFANTEADLTPLHEARELIAKAFILDEIKEMKERFVGTNDDWKPQLLDSRNEPTSEGEWYEEQLADGFMTEALTALECDVSDDRLWGDLAEFIRQQLLAD